MVSPQQVLEGYPEVVVPDKTAMNLYSRTDLLKGISDFLQEALPGIGWPEDHFWCDVRLCLGVLCSIVALFAQFGNNFPKNLEHHTKLRYSVYCFWMIFSVLCAVDIIVIKRGILCIKSPVDEQKIFIDVHLPDFSNQVTVGVRTRGTFRQATCTK